MKITRRDALARRGQAVAAGAVLSVVPFPAERSDRALLDLAHQWHQAAKTQNEMGEAWLDAVIECVPPELAHESFCKLPVPISQRGVK